MSRPEIDAAAQRVHIVSVSPPPTDDEMAAIALALEQAWPEPRAAMPTVTTDENRWRFASRAWQRPAIPVRRWVRT